MPARFGFSILDLQVPPPCRICGQREMNRAEDRSGGQGLQSTKEIEMIRILGQILFLRPKLSSPEFPLHLYLLS